MKFLLFVALLFAIYVLAKRAFASGSTMTVTDAAKLLDVALDADPALIIEAHKRLIAKVHPDVGGTSQLAAQVNQARDTLLRNNSN